MTVGELRQALDGVPGDLRVDIVDEGGRSTAVVSLDVETYTQVTFPNGYKATRDYDVFLIQLDGWFE